MPAKLPEDERRRRKNARKRAWRAKNKESVAASNKKYAESHPEVLSAASARFRDNHRDELRVAAAEYAAQHPEERRAWTRSGIHRRRARLKEAVVERFSDLEIFDRDQWICGLCGEAIDPTRDHRLADGTIDVLSVSLDHIVPIARGGDHTRANVQAAHLGCNLRKSDRYEAA